MAVPSPLSERFSQFGRLSASILILSPSKSIADILYKYVIPFTAFKTGSEVNLGGLFSFRFGYDGVG